MDRSDPATREPNPMVGSIHIYSDGYGYGARYPTSRNQMTLPANVPKYRRPPDTERFMQGCTSTIRVKTDDRAMKRYADQVVHQTSGEIGQHYLGFTPENVRTHMKPLNSTTSLGGSKVKDYSYANDIPSNSYVAHTDRSSEGWMSTRSNVTDAPSTQRSNLNSARDGFYDTGNKYLNTLNSLDKTFGRRAKKDLYTASLPTRSAQELVFCATSNQHSALQSKAWQLKLRRDANL